MKKVLISFITIILLGGNIYADDESINKNTQMSATVSISYLDLISLVEESESTKVYALSYINGMSKGIAISHELLHRMYNIEAPLCIPADNFPKPENLLIEMTVLRDKIIAIQEFQPRDPIKYDWLINDSGHLMVATLKYLYECKD